MRRRKRGETLKGLAHRSERARGFAPEQASRILGTGRCCANSYVSERRSSPGIFRCRIASLALVRAMLYAALWTR